MYVLLTRRTVIISTRFEVDTTIHCPVIAFLMHADNLRDLVTLTFDLLTMVSSHTWRVTWSTSPHSLNILHLSVLELWVLTSPISYHWQCICSHCAWVISRDQWPVLTGKFFPHIWDPWPRFLYSPCNLHGYTIKINWTRMWANAQPDGRPAEHRWRPLFNAAMFVWRPILDAVQ